MSRAALDYVDLNVTRAVQAAQQPGVRGYHRRVFANRRDDSYLLWDAVDAPPAECAKARFNLHVVTLDEGRAAILPHPILVCNYGGSLSG